MKPLARAEDIQWTAAQGTAPESAMELVGNLKVLIPLGAMINKQDELGRIQKEIDKTGKEIAKANGKLANADFVARAPAAVVEQEKQRVADFEAALAKLILQRAQVEALPD
jgi:valyl-tRNA synthetase